MSPTELFSLTLTYNMFSFIDISQAWASIDIHLVKHSTGQPHPAAAKSVIPFGNAHYLPGHCGIMLEIVGDTLVFLLNTYPLFPLIDSDAVILAVYNWKTGKLRAVRTVYPSLIGARSQVDRTETLF